MGHPLPRSQPPPRPAPQTRLRSWLALLTPPSNSSKPPQHRCTQWQERHPRASPPAPTATPCAPILLSSLVELEEGSCLPFEPHFLVFAAEGADKALRVITTVHCRAAGPARDHNRGLGAVYPQVSQRCL